MYPEHPASQPYLDNRPGFFPWMPELPQAVNRKEGRKARSKQIESLEFSRTVALRPDFF